MPVDLKMLMKVLSIINDRGHIKLEMSHEQIVTNTIYNKAIHDVLETLKGIENGSIDVKLLLSNKGE